MVDWQHAVDRKVGSFAFFADLRVETNKDHHVFEVEIFSDDLGKNAVRVELYADGINGGDPVRQENEVGRDCFLAHPMGCVYPRRYPLQRPAGDYTARVTPHCDGVAVPLEDARILWQR